MRFKDWYTQPSILRNILQSIQRPLSDCSLAIGFPDQVYDICISAPFICIRKSFKAIWKKFPKCNQLVSKCPKVLSQGGVELREGRNSLRLSRPCKLACSSPLLFFVTAVSWLSASMPLFCHNIRLCCWKLESFDISQFPGQLLSRYNSVSVCTECNNLLPPKKRHLPRK